ncbi:MAG TPA: hypothetical protein VJU16_04495 [Planctomycetota bacterium]|nr:hypothetical protein [Planctomycetota bacterium]
MRTVAVLVIASLAGAASARLAAQDPKAAPVVKGSRFELVDGAGRVRAVLGMSKGGSPEFDLRDADGRPRALLVLDADNLPIFFFKDAGVVTRAKLELDAKGAAKLTMCDADLTPRVEIDGSRPALRVLNAKGEATKTIGD